MTTQFTPGPWKVNCSHIYTPDGAIIAQVHNPGSKASDYPLVANRDLMAAAPELYEIAQLYLDWGHLSPRQLEEKYPEWDRTEGVKWIDAKARAALAKARGEQ